MRKTILITAILFLIAGIAYYSAARLTISRTEMHYRNESRLIGQTPAEIKNIIDEDYLYDFKAKGFARLP